MLDAPLELWGYNCDLPSLLHSFDAPFFMECYHLVHLEFDVSC